MTDRLPTIRCVSALLAATCLMASGGAAAGSLQVEFIEPERYADAHLDHFGGVDQRVLRILEQHLQEWAGRCLQPADTLQIRVLDIDLAGQQDWGGRTAGHRPRIMREVTWPKITLAYTLRRGDGEVIQDRKRLTDMNYLSHGAYLRSDSMPLPYERLMLGNWFEQTFCR